MQIDDLVKLMLAFAVSFSLIGISFQIMRLIGKVADSIQDLRKTLQNVSEVSDMMLSDYREIRAALSGVLGLLTNVRENIIDPVAKLAGAVGTVTKFARRKRPADFDEEEE